MVILVCYKCKHPTEIVAESRNGMEIINYHCSSCNHTSVNFLLDYIAEDMAEETVSNEVTASENQKGRSDVFVKATGNYKRRARMQRMISLKKDAPQQDKPATDSQD